MNILISDVKIYQQLGQCYCMTIKITPPSQLELKPVKKWVAMTNSLPLFLKSRVGNISKECDGESQLGYVG